MRRRLSAVLVLATFVGVAGLTLLVRPPFGKAQWNETPSSGAVVEMEYDYDCDDDGDGVSNGDESYFSTNPFRADSYPPVEDGLIARLEGEQKGQVPSEELAKPESGLTVAAWVQLNGASGVIASQGAYTLAVQDRHLVFEVSLNGRRWALMAPQTIPDDSEEHYVAGSYDGRELRLYLDGAAPIAVTHPDSGLIDASDEPLVLGDIEGSTAEICLFARALQDAEVRLLGVLTAEAEEVQ